MDMLNASRGAEGDDHTSDSAVKHHQWLTRLMQVPFGVYHTYTGSASECLTRVQAGLDAAVYGNQLAKTKILELVAQQLRNPGAPPQCVGLVGPPGVGKTTLVRDGVARCIRDSLDDFVHISLGGACSTDSATLLGHSFTYEGAAHGAIVEGLKAAQCMNPVILFDECDKIAYGGYGGDVKNALIHLLDPQQNTTFHDRYFQGIDFDISRAMIFLSLNDVSQIDPVLRDRIEFVHIHPPTHADKIEIARSHLIPKCLREVNFEKDDIKIPDGVVAHIINRVGPEAGVRGLLRAIKGTMRKVNLITMLPSSDQIGDLQLGMPPAKVTKVAKDMGSLSGSSKSGGRFPGLQPQPEVCLPVTLTPTLVDSLLCDMQPVPATHAFSMYI